MNRRTKLMIAAVALVAAPLLLLRAAYQPFRIPSDAMRPTLRADDHVFANRVYSGKDMQYGDVIVFRYPLDESEDFLKRVVGMPGDDVRIDGRSIYVRHAGEVDFEPLERTALDEPCQGANATIEGCTTFEETHRGKTYRVRYLAAGEDDEHRPRPRQWSVPEGHAFVLGDNRDQSHDSASWRVKAPVVVADRLLRPSDLVALTTERRFQETRDVNAEPTNAGYDQVTYFARHRSKARHLALSVWRDPPPSSAQRYEAVAAALPDASEADRQRVRASAGDLETLAVGQDEHHWHAAVHLESQKLVVLLRCGKHLCDGPSVLGKRLAEDVRKISGEPERDLRLVVSWPEGDYASTWTGDDEDGRSALDPSERLEFDAFVQSEAYSAELEVWRDPPAGSTEKLAELRRAHDLEADDAVASSGASSSSDEGFHFAFAVASDTVVRLQCRIGLCPRRDVAVELAKSVAERAEDPSAFVDPNGESSRPFVPFDNIKGRVDRVWLPFDRFWKKVQ